MKALASLKVRTRVDFGLMYGLYLIYVYEMPLYRNLIQNHLSSMILSVYRFFCIFHTAGVIYDGCEHLWRSTEGFHALKDSNIFAWTGHVDVFWNSWVFPCNVISMLCSCSHCNNPFVDRDRQLCGRSTELNNPRFGGHVSTGHMATSSIEFAPNVSDIICTQRSKSHAKHSFVMNLVEAEQKQNCSRGLNIMIIYNWGELEGYGTCIVVNIWAQPPDSVSQVKSNINPVSSMLGHTRLDPHSP